MFFLTVHALGRQQGVQHRVAGLVLGLILQDARLHPSQGRVLLGAVPLGADVGDLNFQLVVAPVDELDALLAPLVLLVLAVKHAVQRGQLLVQGRFPQLVLLDRQDQHAADIHQRANIVQHHRDLAVAQKQQVAHRKDGPGHDHRHQRRFVADVQMSAGLGAAGLQPVHHPIYRTVYDHQQQQCQRVAAPAVREDPAVELPLHAGGQLGQHKGPRRGIQRFQPVHAPGAPKVDVEQTHCTEHTGDPPHQRHKAGAFQKSPQHDHPDHGDRPCGGLSAPQRQTVGVQADGQHLRQRRIEARDIGQLDHKPSPPM